MRDVLCQGMFPVSYPLCDRSSHHHDGRSFRAMRPIRNPLGGSGAPRNAESRAATDDARGAFPLGGHTLLVPGAGGGRAAETAEGRLTRGDETVADAKAATATHKRPKARVLARFADARVMRPACVALAGSGAALVRTTAALADMTTTNVRGRDRSGQPRHRQPDPERRQPAHYIAARWDAADGARHGGKAIFAHDLPLSLETSR